jgi:hypothetical protein
LAANSGFDQPSMIALASSRIPELGAWWLWKRSRPSVRKKDTLTRSVVRIHTDQWSAGANLLICPP